MAYATRATAPLLPEQGPDLVSGVVTMDDATFTTLLSLSSGATATSRFNCRALIDTGSPQSFIHQGTFDQMVAADAADASYVRSTTPKSWSGFGSHQMLSICRQARMTAQFHHDGAPSSSLAVWDVYCPRRDYALPHPPWTGQLDALPLALLSDATANTRRTRFR